MKRSQLLLLVALLVFGLPSQGSAQRTDDGRVGMPPVHQDSSRRTRPEALFVHRTARSGLLALAGVPIVILGARHGSADLLRVGALTYLVGATYGAAVKTRSRNCGMGRRLLLASGGALAGAVGGVFGAHEAFDAAQPYEPHEPLARPGLIGAAIGIPLGAAAALYNCR